MKYKLRVCLSVLALAGTSANAQSQDSGEFSHFNDPVRVYAGGFYPRMESDVRVNGEAVNPPPVNLENVLAVEEGKFVPYAGVKWRISRRHSLEAEYFALNRDGRREIIADPVEVADLIIESGNVNTAFDTSVTRLTYGYSLSRSENSELQIKAGLHVAKFEIGLQLTGAVCDVRLGEMPPGCPAGQSPPVESEDVTAPLPHFGISYGYAFSPTLAAELRAIGFAIEIDNIDGSLLEVSSDLVWKPRQHFGIGVGLRFFRSKVSGSNQELNGEFEFDYYGPTVFVLASF